VRSLTLWINDGAGGWSKIKAYFGLLQGGHDGQPVSCLIVVSIEWDFMRLLAESRDAVGVILWKYVDDGVLQCDVVAFPTVWQAWQAANALHQITLIAHKSIAYVPAWDDAAVLPANAALVSERVELRCGGIVLLGGVAEGAYAAAVGRQIVTPTEKRAERACKVSRGLVAIHGQ
jgi:hypothetical protein